MQFAITPCPNDTFSYHALIKKVIDSDLEFVFDDIEGLNLSAQKCEYPITKMSFAAYFKNRKNYELLDAGAALGIGTGPVLVARKDAEFDASKQILVPGENTTGALLLKFYAKQRLNLKPMHFRSIIENLSKGEYDCGVLIHEGRFVFKDYGLKLICDLGEYWTSRTSLPVPLGCICVRKDFIKYKSDIENLIRKSVKIAFDNPKDTYQFVKENAQYLDKETLQKHIYAFVNEYSYDISTIKNQLVENLEKCLSL